MYRTDFWILWEKSRVGCFKRTASKHVYYLGWNRSPAQVGCMRQVLGPGALGKPKGNGWRGRWEGGSGWGNTCKPMAVSFQCMTKFTTNKKKKLQITCLQENLLLHSNSWNSCFYIYETLPFLSSLQMRSKRIKETQV